MSKQFKNMPECIYGNPCILICVNPQCRKPGFICRNGLTNKDECGLFHENCQKMKWAQLENIFFQNPNTKIPEFSSLQDSMENLFSDILKKVKQEHVKFKIWARTYGYTEELMNFIHLINSGHHNQISGVYMNQILNQIFLKEEKKIAESFNLINIQKIQNEIQNLLDNINKIYKYPSKLISSPIEHSKNFQISPRSILDSKITEEIDYLRSMFTKGTPKRFDLLYRASDCKFSTAQFHKRCDNIPNTLLLVKTEYGKILGGFTPLAWNCSQNHWAADKSLTSFIFSLDLREKFQLNLAQFAIACNPDKGPIFGCCDICIVDRADIQKSSAEFPISYNNFKYSRNAETSRALTGSAKGKFNVVEWQVFHVGLQQQQ